MQVSALLLPFPEFADICVGVSFVMLVLTFLLIPETARLTLEQIDEYFLSGRPAWRTSIGRNKSIAKGEETDRPAMFEHTVGKVDA